MQFFLTACAASWIFRVDCEGEVLPCWLKELLQGGGEQKISILRVAWVRGHNCSVICSTCHPTNGREGNPMVVGTGTVGPSWTVSWMVADPSGQGQQSHT